MAEPKIENFFAVLKREDFSAGSLVTQEDILTEFLYYVAPERADFVTEQIEKQSEEIRMKIIQNLASTYPLSQYTIAKILKRIRGSDSDYIEGFDINEMVLSSLRSNIGAIKADIHHLTNTTNEYNEEIKKLEGDLEKYRSSADNLKELREKRDSLQQEVDAKKQDASSDSLNSQIEDLEREKDQLEAQKREKEDRKNQLDGSINVLKKELSESEKQMTTDKERNMLRKLLQEFPVDVEE